MIKLLLDFPWRINEALDADPRPLEVITDFLNLLTHVPQEPVRFVYPQEQALFWQELPGRRGGGIEVVLRFLNHVETLVDQGPNRAVPVNGPNDIRPTWQVALRDEMGDLTNWRTPQIIVCAERYPEWENCVRNDEALIALEDQPDGHVKRVVIKMQSYPARQAHAFIQDFQNHKYALADLDPWDVRHIHYPDGEGNHYQRCRLPRPQYLERITLDELDEQLNRLRSQGWPDRGRYWYLPPAGWHAAEVMTKDEWRSGAFPKQATLNPRREHKRGPVDYSGDRVWLWDPYEGHWDVQLPDGTHKRINHEGVWLD
jgi:hypothetical protein